MTAPCVLALEPDEAKARLEAAGFTDVKLLVSGRRREGRPRVIRMAYTGGKIELVISYFKELKVPT